MNTMRTAIRVVGVVALLLLIAVIVTGRPAGERALADGTVAPRTVGVTLDGERFDLSQWRGSVVVVNVWATWCPPCLYEMPELSSAARRWFDKDVRFIGLAADSPPDKIPVIVEKLSIPYPIMPIDGRTQRAWNAVALPSTYIVDKDGTVVWSVRGVIGGEELDAAITRVRFPQGT